MVSELSFRNKYSRSKSRYAKSFLEILMIARRGPYPVFEPIEDFAIPNRRRKPKPIIKPQEMELAIYILTVFLSKKVPKDGSITIEDRFHISSVYYNKVVQEEPNKPADVIDSAVVSRTLVTLQKLKLIRYKTKRSNDSDKIKIWFLDINSKKPLEHILHYVNARYVKDVK